jgi:predicted porin
MDRMTILRRLSVLVLCPAALCLQPSTAHADDAPATGAPVDAGPAAVAPANDAPVEGAPANSAAANDVPANHAPASGAPATGVPATGTAATGAPATGAPVPAAPATGAPADERVRSRVYGFLNAQVDRPSARGGATPYVGRGRVVDGGSRLGFAGVVTISDHTSALWQLEGALSGFEQGGLTDQGAHTSIVSRNSYVGIEDRRAGRLVVGNNDSAYRRLIGSGGDMGGNLGLSVLGLDLWNNTAAQISSTPKSIFGRGEERYHNSVHYVSPAWHLPRRDIAAVQLAGSYAFDDSLVIGGRRDRYSVALLYTVGPFAIGGAFDRQENTGVNVDSLLHGFGLNTDAENGVATYYYEAVASFHSRSGTYVGVGIERGNYGFLHLVPPTSTVIYATLDRGVMHQTGGMASVAQVICRMTVMLSGGALLNLSDAILGAGSDYRAWQVSLGAKYAFNDHFGAYLFGTAVHNRAQQQVNLGAPVYSNNLGTPQAYLAPGDSPRTAGVGALVRF